MNHPTLLSTIQIGPHNLTHRVVMAPLTRMRSEPGDLPGALMAEYYSQRATDGGLIISEATVVSTTGNGYLGSPGLYNDAQIPGWKAITEAVHAKGGKIFLQLFHAGRQSHSDMQPNGAQPVAPSAVGCRARRIAHSAKRKSKHWWKISAAPRNGAWPPVVTAWKSTVPTVT